MMGMWMNDNYIASNSLTLRIKAVAMIARRSQEKGHMERVRSLDWSRSRKTLRMRGAVGPETLSILLRCGWSDAEKGKRGRVEHYRWDGGRTTTAGDVEEDELDDDEL